MKKFFSNLLLILFSIYPLKLLAQTETDHTNERLLTAWQKMIPRYTKIQFAGGMGLLSAGVGWNYGHNKSWETEVLWGFVPSFSNDRTKLTMTLREKLCPWSSDSEKDGVYNPLSAVYISTQFSTEIYGSKSRKNTRTVIIGFLPKYALMYNSVNAFLFMIKNSYAGQCLFFTN